MGTYLCTGICTKIKILKKEIEFKKVTIDEITDGLKYEIDLELFDKNENEEKLYWTIKKKYLEEGLTEFLKNQYEIYDKERDYSKYYKAIEEAKSYDKILEMANKPLGPHFQRSSYYYEYVYIDKGRKKIETYYDMIILFLDGKIIMECYENILHYFEYLMRLQKDKYPVAGAVKIVISM